MPSTTATAPSITTQPVSQSVTAGQTASFSVVASGTAPLSYQWNRDGAAISGATAATYTAGPTTTGDNGATFTVSVSNSAGTTTSNAAMLTVNAAAVAPGITMQPVNVTVTVGQTATFSVVASGTAPLSYQWKRDGNAIAGATASSYTTAATVAADNGTTFSVTVANSAGTVTSSNAVLTVSAAAGTPFGHEVIVVEENANSSAVVGNTAAMPYLNSLIANYGLATQYYANTHPSIGNYMMLATGQVLTNDDSRTPASFPVSADNVVRQLIASGKTWKAYAEDLPSAGYTGGNTADYAVRHAPLAYLTDVQNSATEKKNLVPFTRFATDLAAGQLPDYSFITPNLCDDAHDCGLDVADGWLQNNIQPLLTSTPFKDDGLLIIVFDESDSDNAHGGGLVAAVLVSPAFSKPGFRSTTLYQHQSTLRLMLEGLGVKSLPGAAATAPSMWEFFNFPPPP